MVRPVQALVSLDERDGGPVRSEGPDNRRDQRRQETRGRAAIPDPRAGQFTIVYDPAGSAPVAFDVKAMPSSIWSTRLAGSCSSNPDSATSARRRSGPHPRGTRCALTIYEALRLAATCVLAAALCACAAVAPPRAWEKQYLARPDVQFDADRLDAKNRLHIEFGKEGARLRSRWRRVCSLIASAVAGALLAAALALPGVAPSAAAQAPPDTGYVQFKYLGYRDWQPGGRRMRVDNPSSIS